MARKPNYEFERRERDRLKAIKNAAGGTVNDVVISAVMLGLAYRGVNTRVVSH